MHTADCQPIVPTPVLYRMYIACHVLRLSTETRFTALVLLHRYSHANFNEGSDDWAWIGATCLFLATKTEDEPRRLRDIINMAQMILSSPNNDESTTITINMQETPPLNEVYWESKKKAIETEQMVLRWLGFDCSVSHPHRAVVWILEALMSDESSPNKQRPNERIESIVSLSFQRLNDALFYPRALQWGVIEMACAVIDLAVEAQVFPTDTKSTTTHNSAILESIFKKKWWKQCGVSDGDFNECRKNLVQATEYLKSMATKRKG